MPQLHKIQVPGDLIQLIRDFGIVGPVQEWWLRDEVQPVALVNTQIALTGQLSPLLWTVTQSAGELVAPAINTRHVDTGQLNAGSYSMHAQISSNAGQDFRFRLRNAADAADVWAIRIFITASTTEKFDFTWTLAQNERFVIENVTAPAATNHARVWYSPI